MTQATEQPQQADQKPVFHIQRIYTKDISFESPQSPHIFRQDWKPEVKLDVETNHTQLDNDAFEVHVTLTATAAMRDQNTAFICEVKQAGIFTINGLSDAELESTLGSYCPSVLYPYAREAITSLVVRGSFPQLNLGPINFDAILANKQQKEAATESKEAAS